MIAYTVFVVLTGLQRLSELVISRRNAGVVLGRGGVESGRGHFPWMVLLHTGFLLACLAEVWLADRPFIPALGWSMLALALVCQGMRFWCIAALGEFWNTRIIVEPGMTLSRRGPYRYLTNPNYLVVAIEGVAVPLVHSAWITAIVFTVLNAVLLLGFRIPAEQRALRQAVAA